MGRPPDEETQEAIEATRERRKKVFEQGRGKSRQDSISDTEAKPGEAAQGPEQPTPDEQ